MLSEQGPKRFLQRGGGESKHLWLLFALHFADHNTVFDNLSFLIKPLDDHGSEVLTLTPVINDVPLTDLIERFEREHGMEPAGGYGGLVPSFFRYGPLNRYFLGQSEDELFQKKGEHYLLACKCGEVGCWPLSARITAIESSAFGIPLLKSIVASATMHRLVPLNLSSPATEMRSMKSRRTFRRTTERFSSTVVLASCKA